jgi:hypothetical protein
MTVIEQRTMDAICHNLPGILKALNNLIEVEQERVSLDRELLQELRNKK